MITNRKYSANKICKGNSTTVITRMLLGMSLSIWKFMKKIEHLIEIIFEILVSKVFNFSY